MAKMVKSIKLRFIFFVFLITFVSVGFPTIFLLRQFQKNFQERSSIMLETTLNVIKNGLTTMMLSGEDKNIRQILLRLAKNKNIDHIRIFDNSGKIIYATNPSEEGKQITSLEPIHSKFVDKKPFIFPGGGRKSYAISQPIRNEKACQKCHGTKSENIAFLDIRTALTQAEESFFTGYRHTLYLALLTMAVLIGGFYYLFNRLIQRPLVKFTRALEEVEHGNYNTSLPPSNYVELRPIEQHFNNMVAQIKKSKAEIEDLHFRQLQHADKLVTLGELAAEMAHEINNPVAICLSRIDYLRMEAEEKPALFQYSEDMQVISEQLIKVSDITRNILKYSKKPPRDFRLISLVELVENSLKILQPHLQKHNIKLIHDYTCDSSCEKAQIVGDAQQIEQMIINLVNNAIDSVGANGEIRIHIHCQKDGSLLLAVADNGQGMDEEIRSQIFSPFFTTKTEGKGTGLGLYIVKKICDQHRATITCESSPGKGTTFQIIFNGGGEII